MSQIFVSVFECKSHVAPYKTVTVTMDEMTRRLDSPEGFALTRMATFCRIKFGAWKDLRPLWSIHHFISTSDIDAFIRMKWSKCLAGDPVCQNFLFSALINVYCDAAFQPTASKKARLPRKIFAPCLPWMANISARFLTFMRVRTQVGVFCFLGLRLNNQT